jgi:hypothetical protein
MTQFSAPNRRAHLIRGVTATLTGRRSRVLSGAEKVLLSLLVLGVFGGLTTLGVFGLFTATTQNSGNEIHAGTVALSDNDSGSALYSVTAAKPGDTTTRCIKTTFTGSLTSDVHVYSPSAPGTLAQYVDVKITQGTQTSSVFPGCTAFTADTNGVIFNGTLQQFEQTHASYAAGIDTDPPGQTAWTTGDNVVYKFDATLQAGTPDSGQGSSSGVHSFVWEAASV